MTKSEIASEVVKEKYANILKENGIKNEVKEVIIVEPNLKGEHMCTACDYVTVKFADDTKDLELFVKRPIDNEMHKKFIQEMGVFEKESTFFNMLLPDTRKFCEEKTGNSDLMKFFPKSYYGDDSLIVLENLVPRKYFMLDKNDRQDFDQAKMVLENLARFHGVFYAFINDMGLEKFNEKYPYATKEAFYKPELENTMGPGFEIHIVNCIRIVKASKLEGREDAIEFLEKFSGNKYYNALCESIQNDPPNEILQVLNHGDCWNNNMMFLKDDKTQEIIDHLLIDLQILRYGSPNLDIGYFMFTSVKPLVRREKLKELLKAHFDVLMDTIGKFGLSVNLNFDEFVNDFKKKCTMGFFTGLTFLSAIGAMKEIDIEESGTDMEQMTEYFNKALIKWFEDNPEKCSQIAKEIIDQINEYKNLTGE